MKYTNEQGWMKYTNEQGWKAVLDGDTWYIFDSRGVQVFYIHMDTATLDVLFVQMGFYKRNS